MHSKRKLWLLIGETFLVSLVGGYLSFLIHLPIPWTLGPLTAIILWQKAALRQIKWPVGFRNAGMVALGYSMGSSFTVETGHQIVAQMPTMVMATTITIGVSLVMAYLTHRVLHVTLASSMLGSIPGGLQQMAVLGQEIAEADATVVAFMQTTRLLATVFIIPFIALHALPGVQQPVTGSVAPLYPALATGAWLPLLLAVPAALLANRFKVPNAFMLGPVVSTALLVVNGYTAPHLPPVISMLAQLCVGISIGARIRPSGLPNWQRLFPVTLFGVAIVILVALCLSALLTKVQPISQLTAFLSTSPGGITEMGITAMTLGENVSVILAYQLFRLLFILLIVSPVLKWWLLRRR